MNHKSRTDNAIKNTKITILCHIIFLICSFITRTIFTKKLGAEYLGIGGLFSNVLTILSFAELGIGSTLVYRLYKPFAKEDYNKINLYVKLYKKLYNIIILVILLMGIIMIPFLNYLVKAPNVKENIIVLYLLYLSQTLSSYLFVYKKTLLTANQKDYIVSLFSEMFNVIMNAFQCISLILFKNFIIYLLFSIIFTIINNIVCSIYVNKKYPFLKNDIKGNLTKEEINELKKDTKGLMLTKVANTAFTGTDNIFISTFIGIKYVGILSNYTLILTTINTLMNKVFSSITASIGNLIVSKEDSNETESVLFKLFFLNTAMYSYICIGLALLINEFVTCYWLDNQFDLAYGIIILSIFELFIRSIHYPLYTIRNALGLFSQYRYVFVFAAILNIILDFILVKPFGIIGLVFSTIICRGIAYSTDVVVVYKFGFKKSPFKYFLTVFKWIIFTICIYLTTLVILKCLTTINFGVFIFKVLIITFIYIIMFIVFYGRAKELDFYKKLFLKKILKKKEVL